MKINILGVRIDSLKEPEVIDVVRKKLARKEKFWIATPNPEMVVLAQEDSEFKRILNSADLAIPDGVGLVWASKLRERVTGTDLMEKLCQESARQGWKVFLLGGRKTAEEALGTLKRRYKGLEGLADPGPQKLKIKNGPPDGEAGKLKIEDRDKNTQVLAEINKFKPDLLFVGFGMGKQERWIVKYFDILNIGGAMVVGGAFDFISGKTRRAPLWVQNKGLEWFWRLIQEPWRIKRQIALLKFIWLILKERF